MDDLKGKVAVITGAGNGIGRAIALAAAEKGMRVVLADIDPARVEKVAEELTALGADVQAVVVDVADVVSVGALAEAAYAQYGKVHLLVNNAGIAYLNSAWETPLEVWRRMMAVNLDGVVYGVRSFVPRMLEGGEPGHIVNVASAAGLVTSPGLAAYCASKFAVVGLSEALFHDLRVRESKVSVSVVCPSWVQTAITSVGGGDGAKAHGDVDVVDDIAKGARAAITEAVRTGIPASDVATQVFDAIAADRFYVLTHPMTLAGVRIRTDDILGTRPPTLFPILPPPRAPKPPKPAQPA